MEVALSYKTKLEWVDSNKYFSFMSADKFIAYLFPEIKLIRFNQTTKDCIINSVLYNTLCTIKDDGIEEGYKVNILICFENCSAHPIDFYPHYKKYGDYKDPRIDIYLYNHIDRCIFNEKYIAIPILYPEIDYFKRFYSEIKPSHMVPFNKKRLCLFASTNGLRSEVKNCIINIIRSIAPSECDDIKIHKSIIANKSCYHSEEFLNLIQNYKFVFVCENSINNGYITEKIFNGFFGRAIPIYNGSPAIERYFNKDAFINANDLKNLSQITTIMNDEATFQRMIDVEKVMSFDNEEYAIRLQEFIYKKLNS
jgi:hypothetical protein